ncbi:DUF6461 domain-containing protein [Streptosporangium amethystogenes subsp. fukuiense]|uniref:DUF6461 domain-containing protein n=1 Tax=Streptosporangium amethystogenes subsp. fukuiense TaxID=698418 RepID=A0ABW2TDM8_9ACTN
MIEIETACLTWIRTGDLDQAVRAFGGHPLVAEPETFDGLFGIAAEDLPDDATGVALVARHGEWAVIVEPFAFRGLSETLLGQVAAKGEAFRVAWTINMATFVSYVRDGEVVASFDALDLDGARGREWLDGLPVSEADWRADWKATAFAVAEHLSGVVIDDDWTARPHALHWLRPVTVGARPALRVDGRMRAIAAIDPRIARIIAEPTPDRLPEIVGIAAGLAVATAGIDGPLVEEALGLIAAGECSAELAGRLGVFRAEFARRASGAFQASPDSARERYPSPGHDTDYGRWMVKGAAAEALMTAVNPDMDLFWRAQQVVNQSGGTYLSEENRDIDRHYALGMVVTYLDS